MSRFSLASIVHDKISASADIVTSSFMSRFSQGSIVDNNISASTDTVSSTLSSINPTQSQCLHRHCGCASSFIRSWASVVLTIAHQNVSASYDIVNSFSTGDSTVSPLKLSLQLSKVAKVPKMQSNSKPNYGKITRSQ